MQHVFLPNFPISTARIPRLAHYPCENTNNATNAHRMNSLMTSKHNSPETRPSLILRLRNQDDRVAWQEFIEIYQPLIRTLAMKRGLQKADAEDVSQEVLTSVAKHIENWEPQGGKTSFRAWLATITKNQTFLFFRKQARRPSTGLESQIDRQPNELEETDFDLEHARQLFAWAARRIQDRFELTTWRSFWLTAVEENSIAETAELLGVTIAQVYVARSRVMAALKLAVQQSSFESQMDWNNS